jgi:hypothetical protein
MQPLADDLRKKLEESVKRAREIADAAARAALGQLGIADALASPHLRAEERELRRRLRAHGRQLGDLRRGEAQEIDRLAEEIAYQHWHRMLFARFLAENSLLMYPDPVEPVPVTLAECEDLAADEGAANGWELAARYAARMLPQIFRPDSPVFELTVPPEHQHALERLLADLPLAVFTASDSLGWVYQFWQARRKDEVNAAEVKIGARELPAVTQLFTEPYMVAFLLDNSLGAWWAAKKLAAAFAEGRRLKSEDECRRACAIPGVPLSYLRFVEADGRWRPAAGNFERWPSHLRDLKALDPSCGSGHFLVAMLLMLTPMRMELEGLTPRQAVDAVLRQNLHGLELDGRCVEVAAFALALNAWRYPDAGGYRPLPELQVACSGLSVSVPRDEWRRLANGNRNLRFVLDWLYEEFESAPVLGSLINPAKKNLAHLVDPQVLATTLQEALHKEETGDVADEDREVGVVAQGLAKAAALLGDRYTWVVTNVPYLARGKQDETLRDFCDAHYPEAKNDLATVFLDRCLEFCAEGGTTSIVLPQNWLFLTSYYKFREKLLRNDTWHLLARLGEGGFRSSAAAGAFTALITLSRGNQEMEGAGLWVQANQEGDATIAGLDVSASRIADEKAAQLVTGEIKLVEQRKQLNNPLSAITFNSLNMGTPLKEMCSALSGCSAGDRSWFIRNFWEVRTFGEVWEFHQTTPSSTTEFDGRTEIILWEKEKGAMFELAESVKHLNHHAQNWRRGKPNWGKKGIVISLMRELPVTLYGGDRYASKCTALVPDDQEYWVILHALWAFCSSDSFAKEVRKTNQKIAVEVQTILEIPFDLDYWSKIAAEQYPNGLPQPYSDDPTQWIFHGHPCGSVVWDDATKQLTHGSLRRDATVLQVAMARLLGYRWPAELDAKMELCAESRAWVAKTAELLPYADTDGIVCIPPVRGEPGATDRLLNLLAAAYGDRWGSTVLTELLASADHAGKSLESWLRDKFFVQHIQLFQNRPFIWHIWDGLRDGFAALVNYHKLDRKTLETLIYTYLGDWISRQKQEITRGIDGAEERLAAAENLKKRLELILAGEAPYDIFVRWKPLAQQPMGWEPDINDGVCLNIRPFLSVPDVGKKGAGVLHDKPNINWGKDRGKDVESAPWYHQFGGERINDHHLSLAEKQRAKESAQKVERT